jgi:hypothetical protein
MKTHLHIFRQCIIADRATQWHARLRYYICVFLSDIGCKYFCGWLGSGETLDGARLTVIDFDAASPPCTCHTRFTVHPFQFNGRDELMGKRRQIYQRLLGPRRLGVGVPEFDRVVRKECRTKGPGIVGVDGDHDASNSIKIQVASPSERCFFVSHLTFCLKLLGDFPLANASPSKGRRCRDKEGCCQAHSNWRAALRYKLNGGLKPFGLTNLDGKPWIIICMVHGRLFRVLYAPCVISPLCCLRWLGQSNTRWPHEITEFCVEGSVCFQCMCYVTIAK